MSALPVPKTVCVRVSARCGHRRQTATSRGQGIKQARAGRRPAREVGQTRTSRTTRPGMGPARRWSAAAAGDAVGAIGDRQRAGGVRPAARAACRVLHLRDARPRVTRLRPSATGAMRRRRCVGRRLGQPAEWRRRRARDPAPPEPAIRAAGEPRGPKIAVPIRRSIHPPRSRPRRTRCPQDLPDDGPNARLDPTDRHG